MQSNFLTDPIQPVQANSGKGKGQNGGQPGNRDSFGFMAAFDGTKDQTGEKPAIESAGVQNPPAAVTGVKPGSAKISFLITGESPILVPESRPADIFPAEITPMDVVFVSATAGEPSVGSGEDMAVNWSLAEPSKLISADGRPVLAPGEAEQVVILKPVLTTDATVAQAVVPAKDSDSIVMPNGRGALATGDVLPNPGGHDADIAPVVIADPQAGEVDPILRQGRESSSEVVRNTQVLTKEPIAVGRQQTVEPTRQPLPEIATQQVQQRSAEPNVPGLRFDPTVADTVTLQDGDGLPKATPPPLGTSEPTDSALIVPSERAPSLTESASAKPGQSPTEPQARSVVPSQPMQSTTAAIPIAVSDPPKSDVPDGSMLPVNSANQARMAYLGSTMETRRPVAEVPVAPATAPSVGASVKTAVPPDLGATVLGERASEDRHLTAATPKEVLSSSRTEALAPREVQQPAVANRIAYVDVQRGPSNPPPTPALSQQIVPSDQSATTALTAQPAVANAEPSPAAVGSTLAMGYPRQMTTPHSTNARPSKPVGVSDANAGQIQTKHDMAPAPQPIPTPVTHPTGVAMDPQFVNRPINTALPIDESDRGLADQAIDDLSSLPEELRRTSSSESVLRDTNRPTVDIRMARHVAAQLVEVARQLPDRPMEISLNPEELGRVKMTLSASENAISITLMAERGETADLLRRNLETLSQEFKELGYKDISFNFAGGDTQQQDGSSPEHSSDPLQIHMAETDEAAPTPNRLALEGGVDIRL